MGVASIITIVERYTRVAIKRNATTFPVVDFISMRDNSEVPIEKYNSIIVIDPIVINKGFEIQTIVPTPIVRKENRSVALISLFVLNEAREVDRNATNKMHA